MAVVLQLLSIKSVAVHVLSFLCAPPRLRPFGCQLKRANSSSSNHGNPGPGKGNAGLQIGPLARKNVKPSNRSNQAMSMPYPALPSFSSSWHRKASLQPKSKLSY